MLFWKIALQLLAVAIAILVNVLDYISTDKRTKRFRRRRKLLFALSGLFLVGSIVIIINDEFAKREEIADITNRLNALKQQGEVARQLVTGGDSYCYLSASGNDDVRMLVLVHQGDYPLYDLQVRVVDLDIWNGIAQTSPNPTLEKLSQAFLIKYLNTLNPNQSEVIGNLALPADKDKKDYNIFILARNGQLTQLLRFRRINGRWLQAFRVERANTGPPIILMTKIENGFPRNNKGEIDW